MLRFKIAIALLVSFGSATCCAEQYFSASEQDRLNRAGELNARVVKMTREGECEAAIPLAREAYKLCSSVRGAERNALRLLGNFANLYLELREPEKAGPLLNAALKKSKILFGDNHAETATCKMALASSFIYQQKYRQAEPLLLQSYETLRNIKGLNNQFTITALNNLGQLYIQMGENAKAAPYCKQSLQATRATFGADHRLSITCLNGLASLHCEMGDYAKAVQLFQQVVKDSRRVLGPNHPDTLQYTINLSIAYSEVNLTEAIFLIEETLKSVEKKYGQDHTTTADLLEVLGSAYFNSGDFAKAEPIARRVLEIRGKALGNHPLTAKSCSDLALIAANAGSLILAEKMHKSALEIRRKVFGEDAPETAASQASLAWEYHQSKHPQAAEMARKAASTLWDSLGPEHDDTLSAALNLSVILRDQGSLDQAERLCRHVLETNIKKYGKGHWQSVSAQGHLARVYEAMGRNTKAATLHQQATDGAFSELRHFAANQSQRQQLATLQEASHYLDNYLAFALRTGNADDALYNRVVSWKGDVLSRQRAILTRTATPQLQPLVIQLQSVSRQLAATAFQEPTETERESWRNRFNHLSTQKDSLEARLSRQSAEYRQASQPVRTADLRNSLPAGAVLVDFVQYYYKLKGDEKGEEYRRDLKYQTHKPRLAAFVIRGGQPVFLTDLCDAAWLDKTIDAWRVSVEGSKPADAGPFSGRDTANPMKSAEAAAALKEKIWKPLEQHIGDASLVLISPAGSLARLPFAIMPGRDPQKFLLEERSIAVLPAPRQLPQLVRGSSASSLKSGLLVLGDVDYNATQAVGAAAHQSKFQHNLDSNHKISFRRLPGTKPEADNISRLFQQTDGFRPQMLTHLDRTKASKSAIRQLAPQRRYVHLATHGYFAPKTVRDKLERSAHSTRTQGYISEQGLSAYYPGLLSGIALAGANVSQSEGILTAEEVSGIDLSGVELCVLSACETGLGTDGGGEGLLGLQRAFQVAGAKATLGSLWSVDDHATQTLMTLFYRNLWGRKKLGKLEALRQAQLTMLNRYNPRTGSLRGIHSLDAAPADTANGRCPPRYWAPFVLSGDWK